MRSDWLIWAVVLSNCAAGVFKAPAADQPQWGEAWSRNMVSREKGLPERFNLKTGDNIKWVAKLGTQNHSTPIVSNGRIYIGTNNDEPGDPKHKGDRGVFFCLSEKTGELLWQLVVPKRDEDAYMDWPRMGMSSTATVEGNRVYLVDNRGAVLCLDAKGLANGNDGPFRDEAAYMTSPTAADAKPLQQIGAETRPLRLAPPPDGKLLEPGPLDGDIVWKFDLVADAGIWPHDAAHSSILIHGDHLYLNTANGVDNTHKKIRAPTAPSLVVVDKKTGRWLARDDENIAENVFHNTWASPSLARVNGRDLVFFCGGNGVVYAFEPWKKTASTEVGKLKKVFQFDFDPAAPKTNIHKFSTNRRESPSNLYGLPVFVSNQLFVAGGGDLWWGKNEAWLKCVDATKTGDVTTSGLIWTYPLEKHVMSSAAVYEGMVFIADCGRKFHCVDQKTGAPLWTHDVQGEVWASPYVADGKVYLGTRSGDFYIFAAAREKQVLAEFSVGSPMSATTTAANGVLYVATMTHLYAVQHGAKLP